MTEAHITTQILIGIFAAASVTYITRSIIDLVQWFNKWRKERK